MTDTKWVRWAAVAASCSSCSYSSRDRSCWQRPDAHRQRFQGLLLLREPPIELEGLCRPLGLGHVGRLGGAAALFSALRKAEGGRPGLAVAALGGVILATAMQVVAFAAQATATLRTHELGASGVRVLFTFETLANGGILFGLLVAVGAAGVVSLKTGLFGRWFGAVSVLLAVASGAGAFSIAYAKLENLQSIVLPLDGVWILVVSIMLLVQPEKALASPVEPVRP